VRQSAHTTSYDTETLFQTQKISEIRKVRPKPNPLIPTAFWE
jgi:hypothetical protein